MHIRYRFIALLLIASLFGGLFWYQQFEIPCNIPVAYRIGEIDSRFNLSKADAERVMQQAERVWEEPLGAELFELREDGLLSINFIFDDRQQLSQAESELRADIEAKEGMSEEVALQYEKLIAEFRAARTVYENEVVRYEATLRTYNEEVRSWNEQGGAPEAVRAELLKRAEALSAEEAKLEAQARRLNELTDDLNRIGARGNTIIADYNTIVEEYNKQFSTAREFAQGDYTGDAINIYEYQTEEELIIVLAHELGHALSLGHVEGEESIMHYLMDAQGLDIGITPEDVAEYRAQCMERGFLERIILLVRHLW
jgi:hypothetical protein